MDPESQIARDARVERLWKQLDTLKKGELDLAGLRKGLNKIDHRQLPTVDNGYGY
jgi:solute carrier family 25 phosphate transporter 23/24/25/41